MFLYSKAKSVLSFKECERGGVVFFIAIVLPVVLGLAVVAIDVSSFYSKRATLQSIADNMAMTSVAYLPHVEAVKSYIKKEQAKRSDVKVAMAFSGDFLKSLFLNICTDDKEQAAFKPECDNISIRNSFISAVMSATSFLPDVNKAKETFKNDFLEIAQANGAQHRNSSIEAISTALNNIKWEVHGENQVFLYQAPSSQTDAGSIDVSLSASFEVSFAGYIKSLKETQFHVVSHAAGRIVPRDVIMVVSNSSSFRPSSGSAWGENIKWPASNYFGLVNPPSLINHNSGAPPIYWPNWVLDWNKQIYQRWATQSCFNPVWSEVKYATISLVDVIGSDNFSRIGLIFTPGDALNSPYAISRDLIPPDAKDLSEKLTPQINWSGYFDTHSYLSDELCAYMSMNSVTGQLRYSLLASPNGVGLPDTLTLDCKELSQADFVNTKHYPSGKLNRVCSSQNISLRNGIYWRAAREYSHDANAINVKDAMLQAARMLSIGGNSQNAKSDTIARRENLASVSTNAIIVISDALPDVPNDISNDSLFAMLLDSTKSIRPIKLIIVPVFSKNLADLEQKKLRANLAKYKQIEESKTPLFIVKVVSVDDVSKLSEVATPVVTSALKTAVLWQ